MSPSTNTQTTETAMFSSPIEVMYQRVERKVAELQNELEQSDGLIQTSAMFDLDGNWVPAKMIETKYGFSWSILNENGKATGVFVPFHAKKRETQAKRGFVEGIVRVPATVTYAYAGNRPHAVIAPADQVGTVKPTVIIATDRFAQEVK